MINILKIFKSDIRSLVKNFFALVIAIGLCFIPSLYAWFNIYSNWDPYANTSNIHVAVATQDLGYTEQDGSYVNMGDEVVDELKQNTSIGWVFLDSKDEVLEGVESGKYYAAVVISEDFSSNMYNVFNDDFKNPTITYYENEKKNAIATKITDSAVATLKSSINEKFIEVAASTIFAKTNEASSTVQPGDGMANFEAKLKELSDSLTSYDTMIDGFVDGNNELIAGIDQANAQIPGVRKKISNAAASLDGSKASLQTSQTTLADFSANVTSTLTSVQSSLNTISNDISSAGLGEKAQATADSVKKTGDDVAKLLTQLNSLYSSFAKMQANSTLTDAQKKQMQDTLNTITGLTGNATDIQNIVQTAQQTADSTSLPTAADSGTAVKDAVNANTNATVSSLRACSQTVENMKNVYTNSLVPGVNNILNNTSQILTNVTNLLNNLDTTLADMSNLFTGTKQTVSATDDSFQQIQQVIKSVNGKIADITTKVSAAGDDEKIATLFQVLHGDPQTYGEFFAQPVEVKTTQVYPISNYRSAVAPFYTTLALWVGGLVLVAIIKARASVKNLDNPKSYQLFFGRYLLFFVLGQIQALIIALGNIYWLHCQVLHPILFWFAASVTSFTFTLFIYSLTLAFGDIGKAEAVVMVVIQIAGSGGTYPIEILPSFYQNVYIFFPFPYAINAMRETIGGMYGGTYEQSLGELLIFAGVALAIGLVIRIPFVGVNHFMEKRMKDTKMM